MKPLWYLLDADPITRNLSLYGTSRSKSRRRCEQPYHIYLVPSPRPCRRDNTLRLAVADLTKDMGQVTMTIRHQLGPPHANGICSSFIHRLVITDVVQSTTHTRCLLSNIPSWSRHAVISTTTLGTILPRLPLDWISRPRACII